MAWEARFIDFRRQKETRPPSLRKAAEHKTDNITTFANASPTTHNGGEGFIFDNTKHLDITESRFSEIKGFNNQ